MTSKILEDVKTASLNLADYKVTLEGNQVTQPAELTNMIATLLAKRQGFCICYGSNAVLEANGLDLHKNQNKAYELLESVFRGAMAQISFDDFTVTPRAMELAHMDVDGFNLNDCFSHDGNVKSRAFMTSKCIHFDAATPFVANTYGLNENIGGGYPLLCDVRQYCIDKSIDPSELVEVIPNNYNIVIREMFYDDLRDHYSVAINADLTNDIIIIMLLNEIAFGVAHGATEPFKLDPNKPARRPIRHFEYQYREEDHYSEWYNYYKLPMVEAADYAGENLSLDYYGSASDPFDRLVKIE